MKKTATWFADKIFWSLLLAPALSAWLKDKEWASKISDFLDWLHGYLIGIFGAAGFPWVAGVLLGFSLGVLLHKLLIWLRSALSKTEKQFEKLDALSTDVLIALHNAGGPLTRGRGRTDSIDASFQRLFSELQKLKIATPQLAESDPHQRLEALDAYVTYIRPFLKDRDISSLRDSSKQWVTAQTEAR